MASSSSIILSRTPFRLSLGGGSTDLPSYFSQYGGFIFAVTVDAYMDLLIKKTRSDDLVHVHYKTFEAVERVSDLKHELAREALTMLGIDRGVSISFKADSPAGTGLGSSGACCVGLLKGLSRFKGKELSNGDAARMSFELTQRLGLADGVQDPYVCALGDFVLLTIDRDGTVHHEDAAVAESTKEAFFKRTLFFYTGVSRDSAPILAAQDAKRVLELKHVTKELGHKIHDAFVRGDLDEFGSLMDEHWRVKKQMVQQMSTSRFDKIYQTARDAGAYGGKIMGAGGGGYFMLYCPDADTKQAVRTALAPYAMREMVFALDTLGARTTSIDI